MKSKKNEMTPMPDTQISEEMCRRAAVGKRKRQMERTGAGNAFDPTCPPTDNEIDDARAALEAALSGHVVGWRTMDSAPKSKNILLFAVTDIAEDGEVKNWKMHSGAFHTGYGAWEWAGRILQPYDVQPTHWQPLPAPPVPEMEG